MFERLALASFVWFGIHAFVAGSELRWFLVQRLGQRAFAHVRARQRARAACEVARAAGALKPGALDGSLAAQLAAADEKWKGSPEPPSLTPLPTRR